MKGYLKIESVVNPVLLDDLNHQMRAELRSLENKTKLIGGRKSSHLNATIGKHANEIFGKINKEKIISQINRSFGVDLNNYFVTVGCNLNFPGSVKQHIHRDTNFNDRKIIINIPCIDVSEKNGSIEVYPNSETYPYSYLEFLLDRSLIPLRLNTKKGDILVRDSNLSHRGMPNNSENLRVMVAFVFTKKVGTEEKNLGFPEKIEIYENWFQSNFLSRLKETIYIYLPIVRSIKRIIASVYKSKGVST
ncbi:phytanoyl-CoA dioxygenase family protein [Gammaproteobacteria bacterium]|nr:phytanoyl-CoA dioxygenase family protein [Gammaproteobacteria bacterium]